MGLQNNCLVPKSSVSGDFNVTTNVDVLDQRKVPFLVESLLVYR
jgi:hypothetical protein